MTLLVAFETLPSIMSVIGGSTGDIIGRRKVFGFSIVGSIPLALMGVLEIQYLPLRVAVNHMVIL